MKTRRQFVIWLVVALITVSLLVAALIRSAGRERYSSFLDGDPERGVRVFEEKGCKRCHAVHGTGGRAAADLGSSLQPKASLNQLVSVMWNHAPAMWERIRAERMPYPSLNDRDVADLFAFLYILRYVDQPGDVRRGRQLFVSKGCITCHAIRGEGGHSAPDLAEAGVDTPIAWAQTMWNHAPAMEEQMAELRLEWPTFEAGEMNDLLAYIREVCSGRRREFSYLPANADRGWTVFRSKGCAQCHSVHAEGGGSAPDLGPRKQLPTTIAQFAGSMWSHSPQMWKAMKAKGMERPNFEGSEMADLIAFLHRTRYFEPPGSEAVGRTLFAERGCARCHGTAAEGTAWGPKLRTGSRGFSSVRLAGALWQHGPEMYQHSRGLGLSWPTIEEEDVDDLVAFLNRSREKK